MTWHEKHKRTNKQNMCMNCSHLLSSLKMNLIFCACSYWAFKWSFRWRVENLILVPSNKRQKPIKCWKETAHTQKKIKQQGRMRKKRVQQLVDGTEFRWTVKVTAVHKPYNWQFQLTECFITINSQLMQQRLHCNKCKMISWTERCISFGGERER